MFHYSVHPLASLFPLMEGEEFKALIEDIREHGLREPVVLCEGQILDGRNRYRACIEAEAECRFETYEGADPVGYVVSLNVKRRHLDESQRAMVAAKLANMRQGERTDLRPSANLQKVDRQTAATLLNVSERSVAHATTVRDKGEPELIAAVEQGKLAVSAAAGLTKVSPDAQRRVVSNVLETGNPRQAQHTLKRLAREARVRELAVATAIAAKTLNAKRYAVIYADPPWRFELWAESGRDRVADNYYPCMPSSEIAAMKVPAADDCVLFLWATVPVLPQCLHVMERWGFAYKSLIVWEKDRPGAGYWVRNTVELLLIGTRGVVPAPVPGEQPRQVIKAPRRGHSEKPAVFAEIIERLYPNVPKIEMFARTVRPGWDVWGNEVVAHDTCGNCTEPMEQT